MQVLPMERKRRTLEVSERIAQFPCRINSTEIKVFDKNGNEIPELNRDKSCGCNNAKKMDREIAVYNPCNYAGMHPTVIAKVVSPGSTNRNFVLDCDKIELNFDTDEIIVESYEVATYHDDYYDCDCPYIYDNGLLLEALAWYCMFKYLSRGSQHSVFSLKSPNPAMNPYMQWIALKTKAANSTKIAISKSTDGWNNFFYNSTFLPRG